MSSACAPTTTWATGGPSTRRRARATRRRTRSRPRRSCHHWGCTPSSSPPPRWSSPGWIPRCPGTSWSRTAATTLLGEVIQYKVFGWIPRCPGPAGHGQPLLHCQVRSYSTSCLDGFHVAQEPAGHGQPLLHCQVRSYSTSCLDGFHASDAPPSQYCYPTV